MFSSEIGQMDSQTAVTRQLVRNTLSAPQDTFKKYRWVVMQLQPE